MLADFSTYAQILDAYDYLHRKRIESAYYHEVIGSGG